MVFEDFRRPPWSPGALRFVHWPPGTKRMSPFTPWDPLYSKSLKQGIHQLLYLLSFALSWTSLIGEHIYHFVRAESKISSPPKETQIFSRSNQVHTSWSTLTCMIFFHVRHGGGSFSFLSLIGAAPAQLFACKYIRRPFLMGSSVKAALSYFQTKTIDIVLTKK